MLKCDQPIKEPKRYIIPKVSKKRAAAIADGSYKPKEKKPIKVNPDYKIKPRSDKRAKQERLYSQQRKEHLEKHPNCRRCGKPACEVHHPAGRIGDLLNDSEQFIELCHDCHVHVELHPEQAKADGLSKSRLTN